MFFRRYGVVENRFCFEGGSRCGRGEGLYVLVTDQGEDITKSFKLASEGKLATRRRPVARNMSGKGSWLSVCNHRGISYNMHRS